MAYKNFEEVLEDWGVHKAGLDSKERVRQGLQTQFNEVTGSGEPIDIEMHEDALLVTCEGELAELKYPFSSTEIDDALWGLWMEVE